LVQTGASLLGVVGFSEKEDKMSFLEGFAFHALSRIHSCAGLVFYLKKKHSLWTNIDNNG
jgi:hypothetical protein